MSFRLEDIRIRPLASRRNNVRAYVSGKLKLAEGAFIYLNGMRLVHSPKASGGLFLSFPAWPAGRGQEADWKETYFLTKRDATAIEQQAIHAFNRQMNRIS